MASRTSQFFNNDINLLVYLIRIFLYNINKYIYQKLPLLSILKQN